MNLRRRTLLSLLGLWVVALAVAGILSISGFFVFSIGDFSLNKIHKIHHDLNFVNSLWSTFGVDWLSPGFWWFFLVPKFPSTAYNFGFMIAPLLLFTSVFIYSRSEGISERKSLFLSVVFSLNPFFLYVNSLGHFSKTCSFALYPLVFALFVASGRVSSWSHRKFLLLISSGTALGLAFKCGETPTNLVFSILLLGYATGHWVLRRFHPRIPLSFAILVISASPFVIWQYMDQIRFAQNRIVLDSSDHRILKEWVDKQGIGDSGKAIADWAKNDDLPFRSLISTFIPFRATGDGSFPGKHYLWPNPGIRDGKPDENPPKTYFFGSFTVAAFLVSIVLLLAILARNLARRRWKGGPVVVLWCLGSLAFVVVLSAGTNGFLFEIWNRTFPDFRGYERYFLLTVFLALVAVVHLVKYARAPLLRSTPREPGSRLFTVLVSVSAVYLLVFVFAYASLNGHDYWKLLAGHRDFSSGRLTPGSLNHEVGYRIYSFFDSIDHFWPGMITSLLVVTFFALLCVKRTVRWRTALVVIALLEISIWSSRYARISPIEETYRASDLIETLRRESAHSAQVRVIPRDGDQTQAMNFFRNYYLSFHGLNVLEDGPSRLSLRDDRSNEIRFNGNPLGPRATLESRVLWESMRYDLRRLSRSGVEWLILSGKGYGALFDDARTFSSHGFDLTVVHLTNELFLTTSTVRPMRAPPEDPWEIIDAFPPLAASGADGEGSETASNEIRLVGLNLWSIRISSPTHLFCRLSSEDASSRIMGTTALRWEPANLVYSIATIQPGLHFFSLSTENRLENKGFGYRLFSVLLLVLGALVILVNLTRSMIPGPSRRRGPALRWRKED